MEMLQNFVIYMLIISLDVDYIWGRPIFTGLAEISQAPNEQVQASMDLSGKTDVARDQRQVVQPSWLAQWGGGDVFADSKVVVTQQNLDEAAAIREIIQKAVKEGHFAVDIDNQSNTPPTPLPTNGTELPPPPTYNMPIAPSQTFPWQMTQSRDAFQKEPLAPMPPTQQIEANQFMADMQRHLLEFWQNPPHWFKWN